ncbi:MAG: ACP S-malonyltransferase [Candidatus Kapaibacterium sp.]
MKTALLFSGQGSQYVGMLKDVSEKYPEVQKMAEIADNKAGFKISQILYNGPADMLKETRFTQPALCLHSSAIFSLVKDKIEYSGVAGHSVGEYAALFAAGVLSFEDAMQLVSLRGKLMFSTGQRYPGTMFAVIGLEDEKVEEVCKKLSDNEDGNVVVPANHNCPGQLVVSGSAEFLRENANEFKEAGARMVKELQVSGAFHSPLMQPAKDELENAIADTQFSDAKVPVYVNISGKPLTKADELRQALIDQLTSPVKWTQTIKQMKDDSFEKYIEIGPGNVLQGLVKRTIEGVEIEGLDKAEDIEKYK